MENKYFTPDIEDICIGYELEMNWNRAYEKKWVPIKISIQDEEFAYTDEISEIINALDDGMSEARVPYLTKEQIEAEGWKYYQNIPDAVVSKGYVEYYKDVEWFKVVISISETNHYLTVEKVFQNVQIGDELKEFRNTIYNGECKDINTFRKIIKLLGI
jgi:hypothetical protein